MEATTVRLYGEMGRMFGRVHRFFLDTNTPAEAVRALKANIPKIEAYLMNAKDRGVGFTVFRGKRNLTEDELRNVGIDDIRIAPILIGSKSGGIFNIILGAVLIIVGAVLDYFSFGTAGNMFIEAGIGILAGGIMQMLTPVPKGTNMNEAAANTPNYAFSGPVNTQAQGNPVPLLYGEMITGSAVISAGITTSNNVVATQGPTSTALGGMGGGCVVIDSIIPGYQMALDVNVGDLLDLVRDTTFKTAKGRVTYAQVKVQPCVRIRTASGIELECSETAPILCGDETCRLAPDLLGVAIPVLDFGDRRIENVVSVEPIGDREVMHITCENGIFLAGKTRGRYIGHHNKQALMTSGL